MAVSNVVKKYYDLSRLVIWQDGDNEDGSKKARMVFGFRDGNPRITVYTNAQGGEGVIAFPCDIPHMCAIMSYVNDIANGPAGAKVSVESLTSVYNNNKPTMEKKVMSTLYIGKSKEGLVYFSVISEGKPKLIFTLKTSQYHGFRDSDKNVIPDSEISKRMAIGLSDLVLSAISQIMVQYTNEEYNDGIRKSTIIKQPNSIANNETTKNEILQDLDDLAL